MTPHAVSFLKTINFQKGTMADVTIRQRNQVTLPREALEALGVGVGDVGEVVVQGNAVILRFRDAGAALQTVADTYGAARGSWGATPDEIEETLARDRGSWNRALPS